MEPGAHTVSHQRRRIVNSFLFKGVYDECINFAGCDARTATLDRLSMNLQCQGVAFPLFISRFAKNRQAGLMPGVAVQIGNVIVAYEITLAKGQVAFAAIHHVIGAGVENAMDPAEAMSEAALDDAGMYLSFRIACTYR